MTPRPKSLPRGEIPSTGYAHLSGGRARRFGYSVPVRETSCASAHSVGGNREGRVHAANLGTTNPLKNATWMWNRFGGGSFSDHCGDWRPAHRRARSCGCQLERRSKFQRHQGQDSAHGAGMHVQIAVRAVFFLDLDGPFRYHCDLNSGYPVASYGWRGSWGLRAYRPPLLVSQGAIRRVRCGRRINGCLSHFGVPWSGNHCRACVV